MGEGGEEVASPPPFPKERRKGGEKERGKGERERREKEIWREAKNFDMTTINNDMYFSCNFYGWRISDAWYLRQPSNQEN